MNTQNKQDSSQPSCLKEALRFPKKQNQVCAGWIFHWVHM